MRINWRKTGRRSAVVLGIVLVPILALAVTVQFTPTPGAWLIRQVFNSQSHKTHDELEKGAPTDITVTGFGQYDVYRRTRLTAPMPIVIWTHGGAWLSGDKADYAGYFKRLAEHGYVVVAPNYPLAPGSHYPAPIRALNEVHADVLARAASFHGDTHRIFLAGDSAGSNLSAEMAEIITDPAYAREVGVTPAIHASQLKGVVLACGIYDIGRLGESHVGVPWYLNWGTHTTVWAYMNTTDMQSALVRQASPLFHPTAAFPPAFVTGGNGDALTGSQSRPFVAALEELGVPVETRFFADDHQPKLPHEYQFHLDADGLATLAAIEKWIDHRAR